MIITFNYRTIQCEHIRDREYSCNKQYHVPIPFYSLARWVERIFLENTPSGISSFESVVECIVSHLISIPGNLLWACDVYNDQGTIPSHLACHRPAKWKHFLRTKHLVFWNTFETIWFNGFWPNEKNSSIKLKLHEMADGFSIPFHRRLAKVIFLLKR